jgi:hypothetical protein
MKIKLGKDFGRYGDNWVIDDVEIVFPLPGDTGQHGFPCLQMWQSA